MLGKLELRPSCPFWFLGPIQLTPKNPVSDLIDFNDIPLEIKELIEKSVQAISPDIKLIIEDFRDTVVIQGESLVSLEDESEILSATVQEVQEELNYTEEDLENAVIFLRRNGNVIKGALRRMEPTKENTCLVMASLVKEKEDKNRSNVIKELGITLEKFDE